MGEWVTVSVGGWLLRVLKYCTECSLGALSVFVGVGGEEVSQVCSVTCESRCEAACAGLKEVVTGTGRFALRCSAADGCRPLPASPLL